jgi:hypothetical protein
LERLAPLPGYSKKKRDLLMTTLSKTDDVRLVQAEKIKNPPRYEDMAGQEILSSVPSGWRVLMVLLCALVAIGFAVLLLSHFQHY